MPSTQSQILKNGNRKKRLRNQRKNTKMDNKIKYQGGNSKQSSLLKVLKCK